jgi:LPXTG-site transpeptidase (sortase) family protein|tara:strand:+ start:147 stop:839 length:693 start_codon:yes stop_codon:yes gene_type:complete
MNFGLSLQRKRNLRVLRWLLTLLAILLVFIASWFTYQWYTTGNQPPVVSLPAAALANPSVDETPVTKKQIDEHTVPANHPRYISIPALGVKKVRVISVGLTNTREIDTPMNISDTAWYDKSATPGQGYGVVVINGHNGGITRDGIFANLNQLQEGDEIIVERGDGEVFTYTVVENKTESLQQANKTGMKRLFTPYNPTEEGLGLITCSGNWVPKDKVFDQRILVRATISQ